MLCMVIDCNSLINHGSYLCSKPIYSHYPLLLYVEFHVLSQHIQDVRNGLFLPQSNASPCLR